MKESDVVYETKPNHFVLRRPDGYYVQLPEVGSLHNLTYTDSVFTRTEDGLSLAKKRLDYKTKVTYGNRPR